MSERAIQPYNPGESAIEAVIAKGDLAKLDPQERVNYYRAVCNSMGLNPLTKPFEYITLNGKLTLYATRSCTDQLRKIHAVSFGKPDIQYTDDLVLVTMTAGDNAGRSDSDIGAVSLAGLKGDARANAIMKAITKAKRRTTLSLVGLGWLDETEVETVQGARPVAVNHETGEIVDSTATVLNNTPPPTGDYWLDNTTRQERLHDWLCSRNHVPVGMAEAAIESWRERRLTEQQVTDEGRKLIADYPTTKRTEEEAG